MLASPTTRPRACAAISLFVALAPAMASAQSIDGSTRLGAEVGVMEYTSVTTTFPTVGSDVEIDESQTSFGVLPSNLGFNLGFGVSEHVVLGLRAVLGVSSSESTASTPGGGLASDTSSTASSTRVSLLPYVEGVFGEGGDTRFYVGGTLGFTSRSIDAGGGSSETTESGFAIGGLLGLHHFLTPGASFDPTLYLLYQSGTADTGSSSSADFSGAAVGILMGVSAWPGADAPASSPEPPPPSGYGYGQRNPSAPPEGSAWSAPRRAAAPPRPTGPPLLTESTVIDGIRVHFIGQPLANPTRAALRFSRYSGSAELANCRQIVITIDGVAQSYPAEYKPRYSGAAIEELLQAQIDVTLVERIANASSVSFDLCGLTRTLDPRGSATARAFIENFRRKAGAGDPTQPAAPPPSAAPPAPAPGTPAAPAAPPAAGQAPGPAAAAQPAPSAAPAPAPAPAPAR